MTRRLKLTMRQMMVLHRATRDETPKGTAALFEQQAGNSKVVTWLVSKRYARFVGGRVIATPAGIRKLEKHTT